MPSRVPRASSVPGGARVRSVPLSCGFLVLTVALGLATRRYPGLFPDVVATYGGDVLWAAMMFWLVALWRRRASTESLALLAMAVCCAVELSQLYQAPWIQAVRHTRIGGLMLGFGFLWSDVVCYGVGVLAAAAVDRMLPVVLVPPPNSAR